MLAIPAAQLIYDMFLAVSNRLHASLVKSGKMVFLLQKFSGKEGGNRDRFFFNSVSPAANFKFGDIFF
jgi:hypothetical protein